jgi:Tol biopolymer transport system component
MRRISMSHRCLTVATLAVVLVLGSCAAAATPSSPSDTSPAVSLPASPSASTGATSPEASNDPSLVPGDPGWLAYVDGSGSTPAVAISRPDGSERRVVTTPDRYVGTSLSWSPDATRIVFEVVECSVDPCATELAVVDVSDGTTTMLTEWPAMARPPEYSPFDQQPDWSPDGSRIVFSTSRDAAPGFQVGRLAVIDIASGAIDLLPLPEGIAAAFHPVWSPGGNDIAFDGRGPDGTGGCYTVAADGTGPARLVAAGIGGPFDWSPDEDLLVLGAPGEPVETAPGEFTQPTNLALQPIDGTARRWLTTGSSTDQDPAWSADGTLVVFRSDRSGGGLWIADLTGGAPVPVAGSAGAVTVDWASAQAVSALDDGPIGW